MPGLTPMFGPNMAEVAEEVYKSLFTHICPWQQSLCTGVPCSVKGIQAEVVMAYSCTSAPGKPNRSSEIRDCFSTL